MERNLWGVREERFTKVVKFFWRKEERSMRGKRRSALYVPGTNERALAKIGSLPTDMIILDLEDSIAPSRKAEARDRILDFGRDHVDRQREFILRLNAADTPFWRQDLAILAGCSLRAVLLPKIRTAEDAGRQLREIESVVPGCGVWFMMETPESVFNALSIAAVRRHHENVQGFVVGTNDLAKDAEIQPDRNRTYLVSWLMQIVLAAKAFELDVIDGVYNDIADAEGFRLEALQGRAMGMTGKSLIHPNQIVPTNDIYSPSRDEIDRARRIVDAFAGEDGDDRGVLTLDGKMVERLHLVQAEKVLARAGEL